MPVILCAVSAVHPLHEFKTGSRLGRTSLILLPPSECSCIGEEVVGRSNYVLQVCISSGATWNQACRARAGTADCGELAQQTAVSWLLNSHSQKASGNSRIACVPACAQQTSDMRKSCQCIDHMCIASQVTPHTLTVRLRVHFRHLVILCGCGNLHSLIQPAPLPWC